jgi:hemoglobin/transferrin/lactoferrin receptor protein
MLRKTPVAIALSMAWGLAPLTVIAQNNVNTVNQTEQTTAAQLKEVTVTSTRTVRRIDNVPATVSVVTQADIEEKGAKDIKDMFKEELGVSVRKQPRRFGAASGTTGRGGSESINIRGIEGNRVLMTLDGIRIPDSYSFGPTLTSRGNYIDVDTLKSAEILRGPASSQFGSDGLAGAVSFRTLDPVDLLKKDAKFGGFARTNYAQADKSWGVSVGLAGRGDIVDAMVLVSHRKGHETETKGNNDTRTVNRTKANPVDYDTNSVLAKVNIALNASNKIGFAVDAYQRNEDTKLYSGQTAAITGVDAKDKLERTRLSAEHRYNNINGAVIQRAETQVYVQNSKTNQFTFEARPVAGNRDRDNTNKTQSFGANTLFESNFSNQKLTYGADISRAEISAFRDGHNYMGAALVPSKPFPDTKYTLAGLFIQDEIELGKFSIIPALRYDYYKLAASSDGYSGSLINMSGSAVTPRLGVVWRLTPMFAPYAQWSKGFKPPSPDQVNTSFANNTSFYEIIGNPNLKPEYSDTIELGFRGKNERLGYSVTAFHSKYKDFISQEQIGGSMTIVDPTIFQYINFGKVTIRGLEARLSLNVTSALSFSGGIAYAKGDSDNNGVKKPLETIDPLKTVLGARYKAESWGAFADISHSAAKSKSRMPTETNFASGSYTIVDIGAHWNPVKDVTISATINNLLDKKYWQWSDVRGLAGNTTFADAFTSPGRNAQVSLRYNF